MNDVSIERFKFERFLNNLFSGYIVELPEIITQKSEAVFKYICENNLNKYFSDYTLKKNFVNGDHIISYFHNKKYDEIDYKFNEKEMVSLNTISKWYLKVC